MLTHMQQKNERMRRTQTKNEKKPANKHTLRNKSVSSSQNNGDYYYNTIMTMKLLFLISILCFCGLHSLMLSGVNAFLQPSSLQSYKRSSSLIVAEECGNSKCRRQQQQMSPFSSSSSLIGNSATPALLSRHRYMMAKNTNDAAISIDDKSDTTTTTTRAVEGQDDQAVTPLSSLSSEIASTAAADSITTGTYQQEQPSVDWLALWKRRLITAEDSFSVHKLAGIVYTVTSLIIMMTATSRWVIGRQELFAILPNYLEPTTYLFCLSNLCMCIASIRMAWLYRSQDLASRNAFVGAAGSSLFSGYYLLWASPFAPTVMTTPMASQLGFGILVVWNIVCVTDTVIRAKELVEGRRDKKIKDENASFALEYARYVAPGVWVLPVVAVTGYINCVLHDSEWLVSVFDYVYESTGHGLQASVYYMNVISSMAAAYGAFFVTLRDKKLISKRVEWAGIVAVAVPSLVWTIDVSARIFPFVFAGTEFGGSGGAMI